MRKILVILLTVSSFIAHSQDSTDTVVNELAYDTTDLYVISNSSRFVELSGQGKSKYAFYYRDLKYVKEIRELKFYSVDEAIKFFNICQKALDTDKTYITKGYNISRNRISKNVLRLNNKDGGYTLMKRSTYEHIRDAFERTLE